MKNELEDQFKEIESHSFAARLDVTSKLSIFLQAVWEESAVKILYGNLHQDENLELVLKRIINILSLHIDTSYQNPLDIAVAAYLVIINTKNPKVARIAATAVSVDSNNWRWAHKIARFILMKSPSRINLTKNSYKEFLTDGAEAKYSLNKNTSNKLIVYNLLTEPAKLAKVDFRLMDQRESGLMIQRGQDVRTSNTSRLFSELPL